MDVRQRAFVAPPSRSSAGPVTRQMRQSSSTRAPSLLVEADGVLVPVQHGPLEPAAAAFDGQGTDPGEQHAAQAAPAEFAGRTYRSSR